MVPLIFPSLNNRSRFRGVSSSSVRWSSHGGHVLDDVDELFVSNRRKRSKFFFYFGGGGEPREDGARKEKSETKLSLRKNSRKRRMVFFVQKKKDFQKDLSFSLCGEKRAFLRHFFFTRKRRERFSTFFSLPIK